MLGEELALGLVLAELGPQLGVVDDAGDAAAQGGREVTGRDDVLVGALGVRGDEADAQQGGVVEAGQRVRQGDLAGLQAGLVGDVALGGEGQPDGGVLQGVLDVVVIVAEEAALGGGVVCFLLGGLLDVCEQCFGGFESLRRWGESGQLRSRSAGKGGRSARTWSGSIDCRAVEPTATRSFDGAMAGEGSCKEGSEVSLGGSGGEEKGEICSQIIDSGALSTWTKNSPINFFFLPRRIRRSGDGGRKTKDPLFRHLAASTTDR